ncbi:SDR family NAD(P)-dependent oxidoreductase [Nitrospinota bacterium]
MPKTPDYFVGKTIIITGAASGIGRATARIFGREGANVLCADIDEKGAEEAAAEVAEAGGKGHAMRVDVTSRAEAHAMAEGAMRTFGRIDFQLNSAGSNVRRCAFLDIDDATWEKALDLNVNGVFYSMQAVLPEMLARGKGVIVNMASMAHRRGAPFTGVHYGTTKGAVVSMSMGVAREFAARGIRCLSLSPGFIDTPFHAGVPADQLEMRLSLIPMGRGGQPEEIGELVLFICSDACEFMTADTVYVNGGTGYK